MHFMASTYYAGRVYCIINELYETTITDRNKLEHIKRFMIRTRYERGAATKEYKTTLVARRITDKFTALLTAHSFPTHFRNRDATRDGRDVNASLISRFLSCYRAVLRLRGIRDSSCNDGEDAAAAILDGGR